MRAFGAALVLFACTACASMQAPTASRTPPDPALQMTALEGRIYALIQIKRREIDPRAKAMTLDAELVDLARQRSAGMAAKNAFADGTGDPHISATRLMAADAKFQGLLGENVAAQHYTKQSGVDVETFAQRFVDTWMASPSHKENLSFADYDRTGVGAALSDDTVYVTQLFASDLPAETPKQSHVSALPPQVQTFQSAKAAKAAGTNVLPALRGEVATARP